MELHIAPFNILQELTGLELWNRDSGVLVGFKNPFKELLELVWHVLWPTHVARKNVLEGF
jgi:hypothetical protein